MEVITKVIRYKSKTDEFRFYPLGDIHLGSVECDEYSVGKKVKEIEDETRDRGWDIRAGTNQPG